MGLFKGIKKGATASHSIKEGVLYDMRNSDGELAIEKKLVKRATEKEFKEFYAEKQKKSVERVKTEQKAQVAVDNSALKKQLEDAMTELNLKGEALDTKGIELDDKIKEFDAKVIELNTAIENAKA